MGTGPATAQQLIERVQACADRPCGSCGACLCNHQRLMSVAAGYGLEPRCETCLTTALGQPRERLREHLEGLAHHRDCYAEAFAWASRAEASAGAPPCPWALPAGAAPPAGTLAGPFDPGSAPASAAPASDSEWDAGDKSCGELVLELRLMMLELPPGHVLHIRATDPGAPVDIPSWCRLTGHGLVHAAHPDYWMRRRNNP